MMSKTFSIARIDDRRGVSAPWMGHYTGKTALQAICACLQNQTWIAGTEPFESNGTQIERLNVREWKRHNTEIGADADYNQLIRPCTRLYAIKVTPLIVEQVNA